MANLFYGDRIFGGYESQKSTQSHPLVLTGHGKRYQNAHTSLGKENDSNDQYQSRPQTSNKYNLPDSRRTLFPEYNTEVVKTQGTKIHGDFAQYPNKSDNYHTQQENQNYSRGGKNYESSKYDHHEPNPRSYESRTALGSRGQNQERDAPYYESYSKPERHPKLVSQPEESDSYFNRPQGKRTQEPTRNEYRNEPVRGGYRDEPPREEYRQERHSPVRQQRQSPTRNRRSPQRQQKHSPNRNEFRTSPTRQRQYSPERKQRQSPTRQRMSPTRQRHDGQAPQEKPTHVNYKQKYDLMSSISCLPGALNSRNDPSYNQVAARKIGPKQGEASRDIISGNRQLGDAEPEHTRKIPPTKALRNQESDEVFEAKERVDPMTKNRQFTENRSKLLAQSSDEYFVLKGHQPKNRPQTAANNVFKSSIRFA